MAQTHPPGPLGVKGPVIYVFDKKLPTSVSFKEGPEIRTFFHLTPKKMVLYSVASL